MAHPLVPVLVTILLSAVCVLADCLFKHASETTQPFRSLQFALGILLQAFSAFGWVYVFRHVRLSTIGALFSVITVLMLALVGVMTFREPLSVSEVVGLGLAVAALFLLGRFS